MRIVGGGARRTTLTTGAAALTIGLLMTALPAGAAPAAPCAEPAPAWSTRRVTGAPCPAAAGIAAVAPTAGRPAATSADGVYTVPASIDPTGRTEVSEALANWLASIPAARVDAPITVQFQPGATYWSDYTIPMRKRPGATGGILGAMWRSLPAFDLSNATIDLNGSTIVQRTATPWRVGNGPVLDARKRWGNPILFTAGATNLRVTNGTLVGSASPVRYDPNREDWMGILVGGDNDEDVAQNLRIDHLGIQRVWGDFLYFASQTARGRLLRDVTVEDNVLRGAGRHGMTIHGGTNLTIRRNSISGVSRYVFDSEPAAVHGWSDVTITRNTVAVGSLGFLQYVGQRQSPASGLRITDNTITSGHLVVEVGNGSDSLRQGLTITGNRSLDPTEFRRTVLHRNLVTVNRWSGVTIADNQDRVHVNSQPFAVDASTSPGASVRGNAWAGATVAALR